MKEGNSRPRSFGSSASMLYDTIDRCLKATPFGISSAIIRPHPDVLPLPAPDTTVTGFPQMIAL